MGGCPHQAYAFHEVRDEGGRLRGWAVSRDQEFKGVQLGWIVDLFTRAGDAAAQDALLAALLLRFRERRVARVQAFAMNAALGAALERRGFLRRPSPMQFCVRARVDSGAAFTSRGDWHVVFGDSDMDR
ncbi:MAG TPA: hypothetical protein VFF36_00140 [Planctomycetota bacterium]|nr:hypothetical protein [Planctomycetota bacterium]